MCMCIQAQEHQKTFIVHTDLKWFHCWAFLCISVSRGRCCFKSCCFFPQDIMWISWQLTHSDLLPSSQHTVGKLQRLTVGEGKRWDVGCSCCSFSWKLRFLRRPNFTPCCKSYREDLSLWSRCLHEACTSPGELFTHRVLVIQRSSGRLKVWHRRIGVDGAAPAWFWIGCRWSRWWYRGIYHSHKARLKHGSLELGRSHTLGENNTDL